MEQVEYMDGSYNSNRDYTNTHTRNKTMDVEQKFNQFANLHSDQCYVENQMRISTKPVKYYTNPITFNNFEDTCDPFPMIGNQKVYNIRNEFERSMPTNLRSLPSVYSTKYTTSPFLGNQSVAREDVDVYSEVVVPKYMDYKRTNNDFSSVDYTNYTWDYIDSDLIQSPDHIIMDLPRGGISTRNEYINIVDLNGCGGGEDGGLVNLEIKH